MPEAVLITIPAAAELLHLSIRTVERMVATGALRSIRIGGSRRIPRAALDALAETGR